MIYNYFNKELCTCKFSTSSYRLLFLYCVVLCRTAPGYFLFASVINPGSLSILRGPPGSIAMIIPLRFSTPISPYALRILLLFPRVTYRLLCDLVRHVSCAVLLLRYSRVRHYRSCCTKYWFCALSFISPRATSLKYLCTFL